MLVRWHLMACLAFTGRAESPGKRRCRRLARWSFMLVGYTSELSRISRPGRRRPPRQAARCPTRCSHRIRSGEAACRSARFSGGRPRLRLYPPPVLFRSIPFYSVLFGPSLMVLKPPARPGAMPRPVNKPQTPQEVQLVAHVADGTGFNSAQISPARNVAPSPRTCNIRRWRSVKSWLTRCGGTYPLGMNRTTNSLARFKLRFPSGSNWLAAAFF
jgi:hypothetical protein